MKQVRILCLLLVVLFCMGSLVSCKKETGVPSSEAESVADSSSEAPQSPYLGEDGRYVASVSGETYAGRTITFLTCGVNQQYNSEIVENNYETIGAPNEMLPDVINYAQADRVRYVEEQLDVKIVEQQLYDPKRKNGLMCERIRSDNLVFTAEYQVVMPCMYDCATLAQENQLVDLNELPGIQMEAPWWDQPFNKEMTIDGQLYFTIGDIALSSKSTTAAMLFNKELYARYGLEAKYGGNPYELVRSGKWTLDLVIQLSKEMSNDLNGDGRITYADEYGIGGELGDMSRMFYAANARIATVETNDGYPELVMYSERNNRIIEMTQGLLQDKKHFVMADDYWGDAKWPGVLVRDNFIAGKSLLYSGTLSTPIELSEMKQDFGMVPMPKGDEEQDTYYCLVGAWSVNCIAVPLSLPESDRQMISDLLNAMGAASANILSPAYLEQCLEYMRTRDQDTIDMIEDYILPTRGCDIGIVYQWGGLVDLLHAMESKTIGSFASSYQEKHDAAQAALNETKAFFRQGKE